MIALQENYSSLMNKREGLQAESDLKIKEIRGLEDSIAELIKGNEKDVSVLEASFNDLKDDVGEFRRLQAGSAGKHVLIVLRVPSTVTYATK